MSNATLIDNNIYGYTPNRPLSIIGASYFGIMFAVMFVLTCKTKTWFYIVILVGLLMECEGYALRPYSETSVGLYVLAVLGVLLAPTVFAMADYSFISKIMEQTGIRPGGISPTVIRRVFMFADVFSFIIQCTGGGATAVKNDSTRKLGSNLLFGGLCLALCVFIFFLFATFFIHTRLRRTSHDMISPNHWRRFQFLYVDMILLIIRSCYRVAEYSNQTYHNSISTNETLFYVLDAIPMSILVAVWLVFHPYFDDFFNRVSKKPASSSAENTPEPTTENYGSGRRGSDDQV